MRPYQKILHERNQVFFDARYQQHLLASPKNYGPANYTTAMVLFSGLAAGGLDSGRPYPSVIGPGKIRKQTLPHSKEQLARHKKRTPEVNMRINVISNAIQGISDISEKMRANWHKWQNRQGVWTNATVTGEYQK